VPFLTTEKHLISPLCFSTIIETELYRDVQAFIAVIPWLWSQLLNSRGLVGGDTICFGITGSR
jgi:hypothetical protein